MATVIPGALADHLTDEPPLDLDTRAALDAARRGRGRTLVIELKNITPLHAISRRAEYLLGDAYATDPQKRAARKWLATAGRAPQIITLRFEDTETAYNASQCSEGIRNGDVLVVESEQAVAFMWQAWPCAVTVAHGEFHRAEGDPREIEASTGPAVRMAIDVAHQIGAPLARAEDQAEAEQALAEAAAADAPPAVDVVTEAVEQFARTAHAADAVEHAEQVEAGVGTVTEAEALYAAQIVTEAEATEGTWRGAWIGQQADDALFAVDLPVEQGALFDDRAAVPAAVEVEVEVEQPAVTPNCPPEVTRASVDAYLAREYPALFAPEQPQRLALPLVQMWAVTHRVVIRGEWQGLIMCGLGYREALDRADVLRYTGSKAVEVVLCEHGPHAHRDAQLAARCEGCGYQIPTGTQWHDACRPRPRPTPLDRARRAAVISAGYDRALDASAAVAALDGEPPF